MDLVKKEQRNAIIIFAILAIIFFSYKIYIDKKDKNSLKNSIIVVGEVRELEHTRGIIIVHIDFNYDGQMSENHFETYDADSLKVGTKVRLRISPINPKGYIEFAGVVNE